MGQLHDLDYVIDKVIGRKSDEQPLYTRRTLQENLRKGRRFAGCARKLGNQWVFTDDDIQRLLDRMLDKHELDGDPVDPQPTRMPSGMSPLSKVYRQTAH